MVSYNKMTSSSPKLTNYIFVFFSIIFSISFIFQFFFSVQNEKNKVRSEVKKFIFKSKLPYKNAITSSDNNKLIKELNKTQNISSIQKVELSLDFRNETFRSTFQSKEDSSFKNYLIPNVITITFSELNLNYNGKFKVLIKPHYIFKRVMPHMRVELIELIIKLIFINLIIIVIMRNVLFGPIRILSENLQKIDWVNLLKTHAIFPLENEISTMKNLFNNLIDELKNYQFILNEQNFRLEELSGQKTHFFQNISHEIRTPLTLILSPLENLSAKYNDENDFRIAFLNSKKLYRLVNNFLEFQKLIANKKISDMHPINVVEFMNNYFSMFTDNYYLKGIDLKIKIPKELEKEDIFIQAEIDSLEKIIFNFLSNSLKFSPKGSKIFFGIEKKDQSLKIYVKDSGVGIPVNKQKEIFDPYPNEEKQKAGFGLSLAKKLTENMGGNIGFESKIGQGSRFWIEFKELKNIKETIDLLIVEDEEDCVESLEILIEKLSYCQGYQVAKNSEEARQLLSKYNVKCIIADSQMPGEEGTSFLSYAHKVQPKATRLLVTGRADEFIIQKATNEAKVDFIIFKPWDEDDFIKILNNSLKKPFEQVKFLFDDWQIADVLNADDESNKKYNEALDEILFYNSKTLLFCDDQNEMRELINLKLQQVGYNTICRANGKLGLAATYKHKPDIIITNWLMPEMSGPELILKIKEDVNLKNIPIILLTAKTTEECRSIGLDLGADAFIGKPFDFRELKSIIKNLLKLRTTERSLIKANNDLQEKQESIKTLMDNLEEGLFTFNEKGIIQPGFSKSTIDIFDCDPSFLSFSEVLKFDNNQKRQFKKWCQQIWSGKYDFFDLVNLAPKVYMKGECIIELDFKPIYKFRNQKKVVDSVICIASDKTLEINLEKRSQEEKMKARMLLHIIRDPHGIRKLTRYALSLLNIFSKEIALEYEKMDLEKMAKIIYYLQVKFASHSIHYIYEITQKLDKAFFFLKNQGPSQKIISNINETVKELQENIEIFIEEQNSLFLDDEISKKNIRFIDLNQIKVLAENLKIELGDDHSLYQEFKNKFFFEQISKSFQKYKEKIEELGQKKEKNIDFKVHPSNLKIDINNFLPLINSFIHIFRNSIDHGIELPEERQKIDKPSVGTIDISFFTEQIEEKNYLKIVSRDDGRGIDPDIIRKKVLELKIMSDEELKNLSDEETIQLIFLPHFSTRSFATETSGRGVGMDEVKHQVTLLEGKIHVNSVLKKGTIITILVPLTS